MDIHYLGILTYVLLQWLQEPCDLVSSHHTLSTEAVCNGVRIEDLLLRLRSPLLRHGWRSVFINWLVVNDVISLYYACAGRPTIRAAAGRGRRPEETETNRRPRRTACRPGQKIQIKRREVRKFIWRLSRTDEKFVTIFGAVTRISSGLPSTDDYLYSGLWTTTLDDYLVKIKASSRLQVTPKQWAKSFFILKTFSHSFLCLSVYFVVNLSWSLCQNGTVSVKNLSECGMCPNV